MITIHADPIKGAFLRMMIDAARELNQAGIVPPEDVHPEYMRGQAELICLTLGLDTNEYRDGLMRVITVPDPIAVITERPPLTSIRHH